MCGTHHSKSTSTRIRDSFRNGMRAMYDCQEPETAPFISPDPVQGVHVIQDAK